MFADRLILLLESMNMYTRHEEAETDHNLENNSMLPRIMTKNPRFCQRYFFDEISLIDEVKGHGRF